MKYYSPVCTIFQAFKYCFIKSFDFIENKCIFTNSNYDHAHYNIPFLIINNKILR